MERKGVNMSQTEKKNLFGGIDLANSVVNTEFRIGVLERVIDLLIRAAPPNTLSQEDIENIRTEVL